jgi:methionyl-tRNA synthetase
VFNDSESTEDPMTDDLYITTSIPYVNGAPHLGHALEFVHVDVLARHRRLRGGSVRVQSGTDDHAIKNVAAAQAAGVGIADLVATNGDRFVDLARELHVVTDDFVRTSSDARHRAAVVRLWRACEAAGDLYEKDYTGLYCGGCEQFYTPDELDAGCCREHGTPVQEVTESNWFFRLSRYREAIADLIHGGRLVIEPAQRRNEVLGFLAGDLHDLSVSRPAARAAGWGIPAPGDPDQVIYVWFDALTNYITGLGYGTDERDFDTWWAGTAVRTHVIGKGIVRFHAIYWTAFLLSAGLPVPDRVLVHDYLTVDGAKIAKSGAQAADPVGLTRKYGVDALRWWLLREPAPVGECDFTEERLVTAYNRDLANSLGNLTSRTLTLAGYAEARRGSRAARTRSRPKMNSSAGS